MKPSVAIIGAGISGLVLAKELNNKASATVFEKDQEVGGRMGTHFAGSFCFDHGAQCFTARTEEFKQFLEPYMQNGTVKKWMGEVINLEAGQKATKRLWKETHLVASPSMNSLCKKLAQDIELIRNLEVAPTLERIKDKWLLRDKQGRDIGIYDYVISTAPPKQTISLFGRYLLDTPIHKVSMHGCYSLMIGFNHAWDKEWIAAKVINNPIKWISVNSTKPDRLKDDVTCIVLHSSNTWSNKHIDDNMDIVQDFLLKEFEKVTGIDCIKADYLQIHRWRYAIMQKAPQPGFYLNRKLKLAATSDWCSTSRIEEVWWSSKMLSEAIESSIN